MAADAAVTTAAAAPTATVTAGGKTIVSSAAAQEQYYASYFKDYNWYGPTSKPVNGETALAAKTPVYTYALPEGTSSVTVSFPEATSLYAYEKKAEGELESWIAGYWSAAGTSYTVAFGAASSADDKTKTMGTSQYAGGFRAARKTAQTCVLAALLLAALAGSVLLAGRPGLSAAVCAAGAALFVWRGVRQLGGMRSRATACCCPPAAAPTPPAPTSRRSAWR